ncbi:MAG: hypothetical protein V3U19_02575 [Thermodesulfobacteriota bacterium]
MSHFLIIIEVLYGRKVPQGLMRTIEVIFNKPFSESLVEGSGFRCEITYLCRLFLHLLIEKMVEIRILEGCPMSGASSCQTPLSYCNGVCYFDGAGKFPSAMRYS